MAAPTCEHGLAKHVQSGESIFSEGSSIESASETTDSDGESSQTSRTSASESSKAEVKEPWRRCFKGRLTTRRQELGICPKKAKEANLVALANRRAAREARSKPWYGNSKLAATAARDLRNDMEKAAAELAQAVSSVRRQPQIWRSLRLDTLQHIHPNRASESMDYLEEIVRSIDVIGRVCCSPFTGVIADASPSVPVPAVANNLLADSASEFGKRFGECVLSAFVSVSRWASHASSAHHDWLDLILAFAVEEGLPHTRKFFRHLRDDKRWRIFGEPRFGNARGRSGVILDPDFLKEYSWTLAKLIQYTGLTLNVAETEKFDPATAKELEAVKVFVTGYMQDLEVRYGSDPRPNSAVQSRTSDPSSEPNRPESGEQSLTKITKWVDKFMTYRLFAEEMPERLSLIDPTTRQVEDAEVAATVLSQRLLTRLYKYYEQPVRRFFGLGQYATGQSQNVNDLAMKIGFARDDRWDIPPEIEYAQQLVVRYRKVAQESLGTYDGDGHPFFIHICKRMLKNIVGARENLATLGPLPEGPQRRFPLRGRFDHGRQTRFSRDGQCFMPFIEQVKLGMEYEIGGHNGQNAMTAGYARGYPVITQVRKDALVLTNDASLYERSQVLLVPTTPVTPDLMRDWYPPVKEAGKNCSMDILLDYLRGFLQAKDAYGALHTPPHLVASENSV